MNHRFFIQLLLSLFLATLTFGLVACGGSTASELSAVTPIKTVKINPTIVITPTATSKPSSTVTPTTVITPTPTISASPTPQIYVIEEYDTLFTIALDFGVTVDGLMVANNLTESDIPFLQIGLEVVIPPADYELPVVTKIKEDRTVAGQTDILSSVKLVTTKTPVIKHTVTVISTPIPGMKLPTISHPPNINPLTGLPVDTPVNLHRRPLMVRVGNDIVARQAQVSLNKAEVVYEEITEWWVTRFTAIFLDKTPSIISPIRSARLINIQLVPQYQGALAHSGGSDPVRWEISQSPIADLDEFFNSAPYFYRPNEGWQTRLAFNAKAARTYMKSAGLEAKVTVQGFNFSDGLKGGEPGEMIFIPYPATTSFGEWHYDSSSGKYLHWVNSEPLVDASSGQIAASNVIIYFAEHQKTDIVEDSNGATAIRIIVNGSGQAWFFRDGKFNKGFWQTNGTRPPYFTYEDGSPYYLKPGNSWIEVVPTYFTIGVNNVDDASSKP